MSRCGVQGRYRWSGAGGHTGILALTGGHRVSRCFIMRICHSTVEIETGKFNIAIINSFYKSILDNVFL